MKGNTNLHFLTLSIDEQYTSLSFGAITSFTLVERRTFCATLLLDDMALILCITRSKSLAVNMPVISPLLSTANDDDVISVTSWLI
jgi:hypothetical protein